MRITISALCVVVVITGLALLSGCGGSGGSPSTIQGIGNPGTVHLLLSDAPIPGIDQVNVVITRIDLLYDGVNDSQNIEDNDDPAEGSADQPEQDTGDDTQQDENDVPVTVFRGSMTVDLLSLANQPLEQLLALANAQAPSGRYKQVWLYLGDGSTVVETGNPKPQPLTITEQIVKAPISVFLSPDGAETLILDFDLSGNLTNVPGQGYVLDPVLRAAQADFSGSIAGNLLLPDGISPTDDLDVELALADESGNPFPSEGEGIDTDVEISMPQTSVPFTLHGVPAGTYILKGQVKAGDTVVASFEIPSIVVTNGLVTTVPDFAVPSW